MASSERDSISRRAFLAATAAIPTTSVILGTLRADPSSNNPPWYSTMRRCGQINVNERDPLDFDAEAWMDYWASLRVNAVLLNGGGILAFYPTQVPYHHRSEFIGSRDLLGDMVTAAKKRGLQVVARMDCNLAYPGGARRAPGVVSARARRLAATAGRMPVALQDLHVHRLLHRTDARHLHPRNHAIAAQVGIAQIERQHARQPGRQVQPSRW